MNHWQRKHRDSSLEDILQNLNRAVYMIHKMSDQMLGRTSAITFSQFLIMMNILDSASPTQTEIAKKLNITKAAVSRHVDNLSKSHLIIRTKQKGNQREYILTLTDVGEREVEKSREILEEEFSDILEFERREREIFKQMLEILNKRLLG